MVQHIEIEELVRLREGGLPTARQKHVRAHLTSCATCRDELDQLAMNDELLADLRELRQIELTPIPKEIDRRLTARLREHLTPRPGPGQTTASRPTRKRPHPDAPRIPDYVLLRRIGEGSFGEVWEAEDMTGHSCAVKILGRQARDYEMKGITRARSVTHPNLVLIRHVGEHKRRRYYVMDFVPGTLSARLHERRQIPAREAQQIIVSLVEALKACHAAGIAHRDIKPENIGFTADGTLKLLDLGLVTGANRTDGTRIGTPTFMPFMPGRTPALDDLYAAGVVLYSLLTGKAPSVEMPAQAPTAALGDELWRHLFQTAQKAAAPHPDDRFQSAVEFLKAIISKPPRKKQPPTPCSPVNGNSETKKRTNIMNTTQQLLTDAATVVGDIGQVQRQQTLRQEAEKLSRPKYRVAVIGQFKVGKSTLINRVFLKDNVLFIDKLAATAVPTEIEQGTPARLEVYHYRSAGDRSVEAEVVIDPSPDDIRAKTAGTSSEARTELARQTARVRLQWPAPALGEYTIVDTPGINETNVDVVATTYRAITEADVTLFVTEAKTLSSVDLQFLRSQVFGKGLNRCLVVVNHDPTVNDLTAEQLADLVVEIKAQLKQVGRDLQITTIRLRDSVGESAGLPVVKSLAEFEQTLVSFMRNNVQSGRSERAVTVLKSELDRALAECEVELAALHKTDEEKQVIQQKMKEQAHAFENRYRELCEELMGDLRRVQSQHFKAVSIGLDRIGGHFAAGFDVCPDLSMAQARLKQANLHMGPEVEALFEEVSRDTRAELRVLEEKYEAACKSAMEPWLQGTVQELKLDGGFFAKIPPLLVVLGDFVLSWIALPGGWFIDTLLRLLAGRIPLLKDILPTAIVKNLLVETIKDSINDNILEMKLTLKKQLDHNSADAEDNLRASWEQNANDQLKIVLAPLERAMAEGKNPVREAQVRSGSAELQKLRAQLA